MRGNVWALLTALLACACSPWAVEGATVSNPIWPQRAYDATRHARSPYQGPSQSASYSTTWAPAQIAPFSDFPVINTLGYVIAVNNFGVLYAVAFDEFTGNPTMKWSQQTGVAGVPVGSCGITGGLIFVPLDNSVVEIFDEMAGTPMGQIEFAKLNPPIQGAVGDIVIPQVIGDLNAILTTVGRTLVLLSWGRGATPTTYAWKWASPDGVATIQGVSVAQPSGSPAVAIVLCSNGLLYGIQLSNGQPLWPAFAAAAQELLLEEPAISRDGSFAYITIAGVGIVRISTITGKQVPFANNVAAIQANPIPSGIIVIGQDGSLLVGGPNSMFYSFDPNDGTVNWQFQMLNALQNQAVVDAGGYVYFADSAGIVYCIDSASGLAQWQLNPTGVAMYGMAIDDDHDLYIVTGAGTIMRVVGVEPPVHPPGAQFVTQAQWPQRGGGPQHAGQSKFNLKPIPDGYMIGKVWETQTVGEVFNGAVAAADGTLYVPDDRGTLYCIEGSTGAIRWTSNVAKGYINGEAAVSADSKRVYYGTSNGYIYALDASTGQALWGEAVSSAITSSITVTINDNVFFSCADKFVYGFAGKTGVQVIKVPSGSREDDFAPAILYDGQSVVFGSEDGFVRAYDVHSKLMWRYQTHGPVLDVPCVSPLDGTIYAGAAQEVVAIAHSYGDRIWLQASDTISGASPGCGGKNHLLYIGSMDGTVRALNEGDGTNQWEFPTNDRVFANPVLTSDASSLLITSTDGNLYALNAVTGNLLWNFTAGPLLRGDPVLLNDGSIVVTSLGASSVIKVGFVPIPPAKPPVNPPTGMSPGGVAALTIFLLLGIGGVGYAAGGYGWSYYRTGKLEHPHADFWRRCCGDCCQRYRRCCGTVQDTVLRRNVPAGYSKSAFTSATVPTASASTSSAARTGGGYGSL